MAALRNIEEYPTYLNNAKSVLTFQDICKDETKYADFTVKQWAFWGGVMLNTLYSVNQLFFRLWWIIVIA